jgi:hypothetical protein
MSVKKSPLNHDPIGEALMYEDISLIRKYPVMEIATLAAGCRGETRKERISDAVELLALVERYALAGKETRLRIRDRENTKECGHAKTTELGYANIQDSFLKALEIRSAATRDEKTGKIKVTSLVGLAYETATGGKADSSEAMRRYNKWIERNSDEGNVTPQEFKARFESGVKPAIFHDDEQALQLGMQFIFFLKKSPKRNPKKIIRSRNPETKGQILSPKTRGSDIAVGLETGLSKAGKPIKPKQFKRKQVAAAVEHGHTRRGHQTRMNGNGSD